MPDTNPQPQKIITRRPNGTKRVQTVNNAPTRTSQSAKDSCDINKIMAKYEKTGSLAHVTNRKTGVYLDLLNAPESYQDALDQIQKAQNAFMAVPAHIRQKFENDPAKLISFLQDNNNLKEAQELGLVEKPKRNDPPADHSGGPVPPQTPVTPVTPVTPTPPVNP